MAALATDIFANLEAALSGAAPSMLATAQTAAPILSVEARREAWLKQRHGKFTASEFHRLMGYPEKPELPKGAKTYAKSKAAELMTEFRSDPYVSPAMQWGIDNEPDAVDAFAGRTGLTVESAKGEQQFLLMPDRPDIGGTPDGMIYSIRAGLEIKCPNPETHLDYMSVIDAESLKESAPEYYWQIQGLMLITGFEHWFFVSYDPRFRNEKHRLHVSTILRHNADILRLECRLSMAIEYRNSVLRKLGFGATQDLQ